MTNWNAMSDGEFFDDVQGEGPLHIPQIRLSSEECGNHD